MNIFACKLKIVLVIFSKFFRVPHKFYLFFQKSFFFSEFYILITMVKCLFWHSHGLLKKKKKWEALPHAQGQGWRLRAPGSNGAGAGERSYPTSKVRRGDLVQGKEQRLHFAGVAVKRYPMSKVRETQVRHKVSVARGLQRADTLKP